MKIVKRDGRTVEYDADKIRVAIGKANNEVAEAERISARDIEGIISYIESLGKKRMLVEDIQDIIEVKLMEKKKFHLAKVYIIYRYKRSIIRQSNSIDASILSILKNGDVTGSNYLDANRQRDVMAGEVSKDLAYRLLLPPNVVNAHKDERIKFCNVEYFTEPIIESSLINLGEMWKNGTVINNIKIESPKSFQSACNILVEIVASVASSQTGDIYIDFKEIFPYYYMTFEKNYGTYTTLMRDSLSDEQIRAMSHTQSFLEVTSGIQTIMYQINTITIGSGTVPKVNFLIDVRDIKTKEEERLVYEFILQKARGIQDGNGSMLVRHYPKVVYVSVEDEELARKYGYIAKELFSSECEFAMMNEKRFDSFKGEIEKFNQGSIAINLARIALEAVENGKDFFESLQENLAYCYEGLLCRNHNLQGIYSDKSPIHWRFGAITRLDSMERIDSLLKKGSSFMTLVVCGFEGAVKILGSESGSKKRIRDTIVETVKTWNKDSSFETVISNDYKVFDGVNLEEYKKYGVSTLADSLEFMSEDYFKDGFVYYYTSASVDSVDSEIVNRNIIIKKDSSTTV